MKKGFGSMDPAKQKELASQGGKAAHAKGTAHQWNSADAREAGRKGGLASANRRRNDAGNGNFADVGNDVPGGGAI